MAEFKQKPIGYFEVFATLGLVLTILTFLWLFQTQNIGMLYNLARRFETFGLWQSSNWGLYFTTNVKKGYAWWTIYVSSIPFGVMCAMLIAILGVFVRHNIASKHIFSHIRRKTRKGEIDLDPMTPADLMQVMSRLYPHNEFFLKFPMARYSIRTGPASAPLSSLDLLQVCGALTIAEDPSTDRSKRGPELLVDRPKIRTALEEHFGGTNPFIDLPRLRDEDAVRDAVETLPWYVAVILYGALARVNSLHGGAISLAKSNAEIDEFMKDVWREINAEKRKLGARLVIGPYDYPASEDRAPATASVGLPSEFLAATASPKKGKSPSAKPRKDPEPGELVILSEHLAKTAPAQFKTVRTARQGLVKIIATPAMMRADSKTSIATSIDRIVLAHGFHFGMLASSLTDGDDGTFAAARAVGVFPASGFLWLRFVDRPLWRFLTYIGMQTPCPEAAGMFDHWQMELQLGAPRRRPEVSDRTINAIVEDARRFTPQSLATRDLAERLGEIQGVVKKRTGIMDKRWRDHEQAMKKLEAEAAKR